jgi:hypothetical protein
MALRPWPAPRVGASPTQVLEQTRFSRFIDGDRMREFARVLAVMLMALVTPVPGAGPAIPELVGSWKIVSYEDRAGSGEPVYPYGRTPAGLLIYDGTGRMAVQLMKTPPPDVASDDWDRFTVAEKVALFDGYVAYFGRYEPCTESGHPSPRSGPLAPLHRAA